MNRDHPSDADFVAAREFAQGLAINHDKAQDKESCFNMRYKSTNELDCFQFHDAWIKEIKLTNNHMIWTASAINAMTTNTQNSSTKDMCVECAMMTFENISIERLEFGAYEMYDFNKTLIKSVEARIAKEEEYADILTETTSSYCYIYGMDKLEKVDDKQYHACFNIDGGAGNYYLTFTFTKSIVEWENFSGEAWYEHPKWKKQ